MWREWRDGPVPSSGRPPWPPLVTRVLDEFSAASDMLVSALPFAEYQVVWHEVLQVRLF